MLRLALVELEAGRSVILHTALGPSDARLLVDKSADAQLHFKRGSASALAVCFVRRFCTPASGAPSSAAGTLQPVRVRSSASSL